jgi:hypothetical protein
MQIWVIINLCLEKANYSPSRIRDKRAVAINTYDQNKEG